MKPCGEPLKAISDPNLIKIVRIIFVLKPYRLLGVFLVEKGIDFQTPLLCIFNGLADIMFNANLKEIKLVFSIQLHTNIIIKYMVVLKDPQNGYFFPLK